jgi:AcrR family transcriptional regulator
MPEPAALSRRDPRRRGDRPGRVNNRDRILETSLELFNERGAPAVSTNTIAAQLAISPGNLYYHFANKEQIIRELWSQVEDLAAPSWELPQDGSLLPAEGLAGIFVAGIDGIWKFRFFFRDIDELVARDSEFAQAYRSEMKWGRVALVATFNSLIDHGAMRAPTGQRDLERLATTIQLVFVNWTRFVTTDRGVARPNAADLAEGGLHAFVLLEPYLDPDYAEQARANLERRLSVSDETVRAAVPVSARRRRSRS